MAWTGRMLEVVAQGDPDKENYWRRMYAEDHPEPAPFVYCYTCARIRSIVAYQRIGWLEPKPKPAKPAKTISSYGNGAEAEEAGAGGRGSAGEAEESAWRGLALAVRSFRRCKHGR